MMWGVLPEFHSFISMLTNKTGMRFVIADNKYVYSQNILLCVSVHIIYVHDLLASTDNTVMRETYFNPFK